MEPKPKPFNINLTEGQRQTLEAYRAAHGLRSEADAVRHMINRYGGGLEPAVADAPAPMRPSPAAQSFSHGRSKTVVVPTKRERAEPSPVHSRLKGEWKAP